jgi:hypothetical protein
VVGLVLDCSWMAEVARRQTRVALAEMQWSHFHSVEPEEGFAVHLVAVCFVEVLAVVQKWKMEMVLKECLFELDRAEAMTEDCFPVGDSMQMEQEEEEEHVESESLRLFFDSDREMVERREALMKPSNCSARRLVAWLVLGPCYQQLVEGMLHPLGLLAEEDFVPEMCSSLEVLGEETTSSARKMTQRLVLMNPLIHSAWIARQPNCFD